MVSILDPQQLEFEKEATSLENHLKNSQQIIKEHLSKGSLILILDISQGAINPKKIPDQDLLNAVIKRQFGNGPIGHGQAFRHILGFKLGDPRVVIWDIPKNPQKPLDLSQFDAFIVTGGPAMPSELLEKNASVNTRWLKTAATALQKLTELQIPGLCVCLGHQLWHFVQGSEVGPLKKQREFGSVTIKANNVAKKLQMFEGLWDNNGELLISSSHSESVLSHPNTPLTNTVLMSNDYSDYQGAVFGLKPGQSIEEADSEDNLVISIQNHPELLAIFLETLKRLRYQSILKENIPIDDMVFLDTPDARKIFLNFLKLVGRRTRKRI